MGVCMKIKYIVFVAFTSLLFFLVGYNLGRFNKFNKITRLINNGNNIVYEHCNRYSYEKHFGILHMRKWNGFIELKYLIYDNEIREINVSFDSVSGRFVGYDTNRVNTMEKTYREYYYPFLE
jgi:hypothetical protein